ncbi:MAG: hypothetical protein WDM90_24275 [Ferruginibacter sp.]
MKKIIIAVSTFFVAFSAFSQTLNQISFSGATNLSFFSFITDQQAQIRISAEGNIIEWGIAYEQGRMGYYEGKLQPYMGRVDYYGQEADAAYKGKVKSIGACTITYFPSSSPDEQKGKVKSIGMVMMDYYMNYDNESIRGKLKSAGGTAINYFLSYDNEAYKGKLKNRRQYFSHILFCI